jgi:RHS repeat-associated protein
VSRGIDALARSFSYGPERDEEEGSSVSKNRGLLAGGLFIAAALLLWSPIGVPNLRQADSATAARLSPSDLPAADPAGDRPDRPVIDRSTPLGEVPREPGGDKPLEIDPANPPQPTPDSVVAERSSPTKLVWRTGDGAFAAAVSPVPKWFKDGEGRWAEIDPSVVPAEGVPGGFRTTAGAWSATFAPVAPGSGGVSVESADGSRMSWRPSAPTRPVSPVVSEDRLTVTYPGVWDGVDLRYQLSTIGVREEMVLSSAGVATAFSFDVDQRLVRDAEAERAAQAERDLPEAQKRVARFALEGSRSIQLGAPRMIAANGLDLWEAPVSADSQPRAGGSTWVVGVDANWVKAQPADMFPLVLDPDVTVPTEEAPPDRWLVLRNGSQLCGYNYPGVSTFCWPRNGNSWFGANYYDRTYVSYDTESVLGDEPLVERTLQSASLQFDRLDGVTSSQTLQIRSMTQWNWAGGTSNLLASIPFASSASTSATSWVNENSATHFHYRGPETSGVGTWKSFLATLYVTWSENYTPIVAKPGVPLVVPSTSPSISVEAYDPDTDSLTYDFDVSHSYGFEASAAVTTVSHGPTMARSVTKTIPDLPGGATYWVRVRATDQSGNVSAWSEPSPFHINQRLGSGAGAPTEEVGPFVVNTATGNVSTGVGTPQYQVVGGSLGATFTYNSNDDSPAGVLPQRWTMSGPVPEAEYSSARINSGGASGGGSVTLTRPDGSTHEHHRFLTGGTEYYESIVPSADVVTVDSNVVKVSSSAGLEYEFTPATAGEEAPLQQVRQIADILAPASPLATWSGSGSSLRLDSVEDPVSGQEMQLTYGDGDCPDPEGPGSPDNAIDAPDEMICKVVVPGGQETKLFYTGTTTSPRLARVDNPGSAVTDFVYGTGDELIGVRTPHSADVVAAASTVGALSWATGSDAVGPVAEWRAEYADNKVQKIWSPLPKSGGARLWTEFDFDPSGLSTTVTWSGGASSYREYNYDDAGRIQTVVTPTPSGTRVQSTEWVLPDFGARDFREQVVATSDSATGLKSTTRYDASGRPVESYGPAPISAFASGNYPSSGVPKTTTRYDENLSGLQARGWENTSLAGAPKHASLNFENSNGLAFTDWGSGAPAGLNHSAGNDWSTRLTGELSFSAAGAYQFQVWSNVGYRVWINEELVLDRWSDPDAPGATGWTAVTSGTGAGSYQGPAGTFTAAADSTAAIRVELMDTHGRASFGLLRRPGTSGSWTEVGPTQLAPRLDLVTSTTDADGKTTRSTYTGGSVSAVYGLPITSVTETSPANLVETYEYETDFLRRTSRTLPAGAGSEVTYDYEDGTADSPCDSSTGVEQAGRETRSISATSGSSGDAMTYKTFYNAQGLVEGSTSGAFSDVDAGTTAWTCTAFDSRGRSIEEYHPPFGGEPARTVTANYAVSGNPLISSATDPSGTITTQVDLLGRTSSVTDVWGVMTTTSYDSAGRADSTTTVAGSTSFTRATTFDSYGRATVQTLNSEPIANVTYDDADRMTAVTYPSGSGNAGNGTSGAFVYSSSTGELNKTTWTQSDSTLLTSDEITERWLTGRIRDQAIDGIDVNGATDNYTYDGAWRLTGAVVPEGAGARTYSYAFAATGGCGDATTAGANSNRTTKTVTPYGGSATATTYCYDKADRLTSTSDTSVGTLGYDSHGNTTTLGNETHVYDNANRHMATTSAAAKNVVLVVGNPSSLSHRDRWLRDRLEAGDWTVSIVDDDAMNSGTLTGKQLVVISESIGGAGLTNTGSVLVGADIPVVAAESYIYDDLGMTGTGSNQGNTSNSQDSLDITAAGAGHPLGGDQPQGNVTTSTAATMGHGWGKPNSNAVVAATIDGDATKAAIFGYDTSASMVTGTAPARRVGFFYYGGNGSTTFNDNAARLFDASVQWAARSVPTVEYERDLTDRIIERSVNGVVEARYAHSASGDSPSLTLDSAGNATGASIGLPGGAMYQWIPSNPSASKWEYPNLQGSLVATASPTGIKSGATRIYDPDGQQLAGTEANSMPGQFDYGWLGGHQRPLEHQGGLQPIVQMGARAYHPQLARFLGVDPIAGAMSNDYAYVIDSVNGTDITGTGICLIGRNPNGSCRGSSVVKRGYNAVKGVVRESWQVARANANVANGSTALGLTVAAIAGASCAIHGGELTVICTGARRLRIKGGFTIGNVFVTGLSRREVGPRLIAHEAKHSDQWAILGWGMGPAYAAAYFQAGECNIFERLADYTDGGYYNCAARQGVVK